MHTIGVEKRRVRGDLTQAVYTKMTSQGGFDVHSELWKKYRLLMLVFILPLTIMTITLLLANCVLYQTMVFSTFEKTAAGRAIVPNPDLTHGFDCASRSFSDDTGVLDGCAQPLITMFTTMEEPEEDDEDENMKLILSQQYTILNWIALGSCVQPVLYVNDTNTELARFARKHDWIVETVPRAVHDMPVLKSMFLSSFASTSTPLYLYANAGTLFDLSLVKTSRSLLCALLPGYGPSVVRNKNSTADFHLSPKGIFAVGRTKNVAIPYDWNRRTILPKVIGSVPVADSKSNQDEEPVDYLLVSSGHQFVKLPITAAETAVLFLNDSLDSTADESLNNDNDSQITDLNPNRTFTVDSVSRSGHFSWRIVPDFVVGPRRAGHEKWLIAHAVYWNVSLSMDLSRTVRAIIPVGRHHGVHSTRRSPEEQSALSVNLELTGKRFNAKDGQLCRLPWYSALTIENRITFVPRTERQESCWGGTVTSSETKKRENEHKARTGGSMPKESSPMRGLSKTTRRLPVMKVLSKEGVPVHM